MNQELDNILDVICEKDPRYKQDAYAFVMEALNYTQKKFRRPKHVSGRELLEGIKELLADKFGAMSTSVLTYWGIKTTEDFGHIVLVLIYFLISTMILPAISLIESYTKNNGFINDVLPPVVSQMAFWLVSFAIIFVAFLVIYSIIPQGLVQWRTYFVSALSAAILWEVAKQIFGF